MELEIGDPEHPVYVYLESLNQRIRVGALGKPFGDVDVERVAAQIRAASAELEEAAREFEVSYRRRATKQRQSESGD